MDQLFRLKNTFADYLSPIAKRRRTIGPTTATPTKENVHTFLTPNSEPQGNRKRAAVFGTAEDTYETSPDANPRKRGRFEFELEDDGSGVGPDDSVSQLTGSDDEEDTELRIEDVADEEMRQIKEELGTIDLEAQDDDLEMIDQDAAAQAKVQEYLERQAELESRRDDVERARAAGDWHTDELFLFERLTMRSFEPLIPELWKVDFATLPEVVFTNNPLETFINCNSTSSARGAKALQELIKLGSRVREKMYARQDPEHFVEREINRYIKYTEKDGGFERRRFLPVISIVKARPGQEIDKITSTIESEMTFLAEKHRENVGFHFSEGSELDANKRTPPLLYGMLIARKMVIFVTLDSAKPDSHVRHIAHSDFSVKNMDVWNGFAIAIVAMCARNYTMAIKDELEVDDDPLSDPDL